MIVTRTSQLSGKTHTREIDVEPGLLVRWVEGRDRRLIQDAFPHLDADDREFIMTGITPEEWDEAFAPGDLEDEDQEDLKGQAFDSAQAAVDASVNGLKKLQELGQEFDADMEGTNGPADTE